MKFGLIENGKRVPFFGFMGMLFIIGLFLGSNVIGDELKSTDLICTNAKIKNIITVGYNNSVQNQLGEIFFNTDMVIPSKSKNIVKIWAYFMFNQNGVIQITNYASDRDLSYNNPLGYQKALFEFDLNKKLVRRQSDIFYDCSGKILSKNINSKNWKTITAGSSNDYILEALKNRKNKDSK